MKKLVLTTAAVLLTLAALASGGAIARAPVVLSGDRAEAEPAGL